jgi:hypothetical protein
MTAHATPDAGAAVVQTLPIGTLVRVVESSGDWAFVTRDGEAIGYGLADSLLSIQ